MASNLEFVPFKEFVENLPARTVAKSSDKSIVSNSTDGPGSETNAVQAQKILGGNLSPEFDPNKPNDDGGFSYYEGESVTYLGKNWVFIINHRSGPWNFSDVEQAPLSKSIVLEGVGQAVQEWLDEHPEATTTVEDDSLTFKKLVNGTLNFVTPEMFGAAGDGITDDSSALTQASRYGVVELGNKTYRIKEAVVIQNKCLFRNGKIVADFAEYTAPVNSYFVFYIDANNYEVVFDKIEIVCENPASYVNHTSYNRLEAIRINDNDGTSLKCLNCNIFGARQFVNAKGESKLYIEGCNVKNTYEFIYANKSKIVVLNSCFVQASGTDQYVHFLYQSGGADSPPYNNYAFISNCDITTNSATFSPGSGSNPNGTTFDVFIFNCSIKVLNGGCFYTLKGVKYFIDGCKIDCVSDVFYSSFIDSEITIENTIVVNCNKMTSAFIGTLNAINCSFIGRWVFTEGSSVLNFKNCTLDFTGSTSYCFYVPYDVSEIKFFNCNLINPTTQLIFYAKCNNKYHLYNSFVDSEDIIPITFNPLDVYDNGIWFYNSVVKTSKSNWNDTTKVHTISNFMLP